MANRLATALERLRRLEQSIQVAPAAGVLFGEAFVNDIAAFASHMEEEAGRLEASLESQRLEDPEEDKPYSPPVRDQKRERASAREEAARPEEEKTAASTRPKRNKKKKRHHDDSLTTPPAPAPAPALAPAGKREKFSLFSVAKTPKGAVVLYDPRKVVKRGTKAELVTVPLTKKNNARIKRTDLQACSWTDLTLDQQDSLTTRMCAEVRLVAEKNLGVITAREGAGQILTIFRGGDAAVSAVSASLFQKGSVLQMLARNAAVRASYRAHVPLQGQPNGVRLYEIALQGIIDSYGVDFSVETLRRYRVVGELFHLCPALMLCDFVSTFQDRKELFEHMLARPHLKQEIDGILGEGPPIASGPVVQLLADVSDVEGHEHGAKAGAQVVENDGSGGMKK